MVRFPLILRCTWAASLPAGSVRFAHSGRMNMTRSCLASMPCSSDWPGPSQARPFHATGGYQAPTLHGSAMPTAFLRGRVRAAVGRVQQVPTDVVNQSLRSSRSRPSVWVENRKPGLTPREAFLESDSGEAFPVSHLLLVRRSHSKKSPKKRKARGN